jgi:phosphomethylpyrimidine synthase
MCGPRFCSMKISKTVIDMFAGDAALNSDDATVVAGLKAKSEEFKAQGSKVYLPVVD